MTIPTVRGTITVLNNSSDRTELVVLGPSLGTSTAVWDQMLGVVAQCADLSPYRFVRFDLPGHGSSPVARQSFSLSELAQAVLNFVDDLGGGRFHYAGVSIGGAIGIELATIAQQRLRSLTLVCTDAQIGTEESWMKRASDVRTKGTSSLVAASASRWFGPGFIERHPEIASPILEGIERVDDESYAFCAETLISFDRRTALANITIPTLVVSAAHDSVTPVEDMARLAAALSDARSIVCETASHLAPLEEPAKIADAMVALFDENEVDTDPEFTRGLQTRKAVLGEEHVEAAAAKATEFTAPFQDFVTRYAWGGIWSRSQLSREERSIATLASLVTSGHMEEFRMHVRAAVRNGLTESQIAETIMHTALYAGLPAANSALAAMTEVLNEDRE